MTRALITGITGQDGSYLAELLLSKGYEVHGIVRRAAVDAPARLWRLKDVLDRVHLHPGAVENHASVFKTVEKVQPEEVYHLAAQSFVKESFDDPFTTTSINVQGTLNLLEAVKDLVPWAGFYFAATSEMFGNAASSQNEETPMRPRSPYAVSKRAGFDLVRMYREAYDLQACSGIAFNHESPRRGLEFVTRKVCKSVARIKAGLETKLVLGNLDAERDWGFAGDYVEAMWRMLQAPRQEDYVLATGATRSVRDLCERAFARAGLDWTEHVEVDDAFKRPAEVNRLCGDAGKIKSELGWVAQMSFEDLVDMMVDAELTT